MTTLNDACKIAQLWFQEKIGLSLLLAANETAESYIFFSGSENEPPLIGAPGCLVDKKTGVAKSFILPSEENFDILDNSKEIEIPKEFK